MPMLLDAPATPALVTSIAAAAVAKLIEGCVDVERVEQFYDMLSPGN